MPPDSPTILGAFATSFVALIGLITWILRTQILQSQKLIESLPEIQKLFCDRLDRMADSHQRQLQTIADAFEQGQKELAESLTKLAASLSQKPQ